MRFARRQLAVSGPLSIVLAACLILPLVARAEDEPRSPPAVADAIYKGIVGKALDVVPMEPDKRVALQRANAVVSNTLTGRSLSVWAGLTNPILLIGGLVWGLFAASHIKDGEPAARIDTTIVEPPRRVEMAQNRRPENGDGRPETGDGRAETRD